MNQDMTNKVLRDFGLLLGAAGLVYAVWPFLFRGEPPRIWAAGIGGLFGMVGLVMPSVLKHPYRAWMMVGHALGWVNTRIILGILYYGVVVPMGLVMKVMGRDPMHRAIVPGVDTYRVVREPRAPSHMRNMF